MLEPIRMFLGEYYLQLKFIHLTAVMVWVWSTSVAYAFYLVPVFKAWRRNPTDQEIVRLRNWMMERFDQGASYEHFAFPVILITGPLLFWAGGFNAHVGWLMLKLLFVAGIFIPIEVTDYYLAHFGGAKHRYREAGDAVGYERAVQHHWWFLLLSSPAIMVSAMIVLYLAITKPF
ncbi:MULTISPECIES: hypothetical protein [unclassified Hyphomonas]|jgi:uncharacterized membrane protein|uniref:hypothetical protein n=1 Tax=unclassified Hyphomonas TaxID=2630699 RepID=UPI00045917A0|nr:MULTISPECIES: hypothetical protein [unclassified Hyphomonas]KCZ46952.1 hypothetical protein HY17_05995 [Hyphomonas sp. CY54-11-8]RAN39000.1 hypothetical protein HY26_03100 [Hyphomonas sp. GM-8P]